MKPTEPLVAENSRLKEELDKAREALRPFIENYQRLARESAAIIIEQAEEIERLKAALAVEK